MYRQTVFVEVTDAGLVWFPVNCSMPPFNFFVGVEFVNVVDAVFAVVVVIQAICGRVGSLLSVCLMLVFVQIAVSDAIFDPCA